MTQPTARQRLHGLGAAVLILVLVVAVPVLLVAIGQAPWDANLGELRTLLSSPDDGTLAMGVFAAVAWIAWAFVAASVVLEVVSRVRGLPTPSLPGIAGPQRAVGQLVSVAALLFIVTPPAVAAFPAAPAHAAVAAPVIQAPHPSPYVEPSRPQAAPSPAEPKREAATIDYTVRRGDSLWKIADRLLGSGMRFTEIVELNEDVLHGRPDFIVSGTVLKVPYVAPPRDAEKAPDEYVVQAGDTLSEIAEDTLGDPSRYPALFAASRDTVQSDGARLTDPNLIRPGWEITIPSAHTNGSRPSEELPNEAKPPITPEPPIEEPPAETPPTAAPQSESATAGTTDSGDEVDSSAPGWLMPGLAGAGAVLAAGILLAVRAHRNTQLRYRLPGQTIAPPPPDLRAVEKTAFVSGAPLTATIEDLNCALNHLAGECSDSGRPLPQLATAVLSKGTVTLHLAEDADLPEPWTGTGSRWKLELTVAAALPDRGDVLSPYPLLVTVGQDDDGLHLVNLEHLGVVTLTGDQDRSAALALHIAAELALNPWSVLVEVNVIGLGEELVLLDDLRLRHHANGEQLIPNVVRDVETSLENRWGDPDPYRAVITTGDGSEELAPLLASPTSRIGVAVVSLAEPRPESTVIAVDGFGRLRAPCLGLDVESVGLTPTEAKACAAIVDLTRESKPERIAPFDQAADGWRALADQAGALHEELTHVREEGPAGNESLLPGSSEEYVAVSATTAEDIRVLAPIVPEKVRRLVEEADPTLDEDVTEWFDTESRRPRLVLLGAVHAEAFGEFKPVIAKRRPYFVEILGYLALHPKGATASEVADAFGIAASRARTDVSSLRDWLGTNPRTAAPYLPAANESPAFFESGVKTYQVQDVLVDLDLFRRLRARGEARGTDGIEDLKTAMSLVDGHPFSLLRERGWSWLLDTERVHETVGCAIVDTAHVLVVDALAKGDLDLAREVAECACEAAPYDDICRLDLVKVAAAEGHEDAAEQVLGTNVFNRTDDYLGPIELPARTGEVVCNEGWGTATPRPPA